MAVARRVTVLLSLIPKVCPVLLAMSSLTVVLIGLLLGQSWAMGAPEEDGDDKVMLVCAMGGLSSDLYLLIGKGEGIAQIVNIANVPDGELNINENEYILHFPETPTRWEAVITVNRYSGEVVWEFGNPPFGAATKGNIVRRGACEQKKSLKKF